MFMEGRKHCIPWPLLIYYAFSGGRIFWNLIFFLLTSTPHPQKVTTTFWEWDSLKRTHSSLQASPLQSSSTYPLENG